MPYLSLPHLLLAATMASAPTSPRPARDAASTAADGEQARSAAARAHYSARRYREAAQTYEQLYRDTRSTKYLFNAGMARAAAEHDGAAIFHWKTYLAISPDVTPADRTVLAGEIAAAQRRTLPVQLRLDGPLAPATLTLRAPDGAPQGPRDPLDLPPAAAIDLSLEAGSWIATLARPGRPDIVASFRVAADAEPVITLAEPSESAAPASNLPGNLPGDLAGNLPGDLAGNLPDDTPGTLTIRFDPLRAPARGIHLQLDGPQPATRRVRERALSLLLPPGDWTVHASARDREPAAAAVTLGPGDTQRLQLHLPRTHDARVRLGLGLGLGGAGLVLFTAGAVVAARAPTRGLVCEDADTCRATANAVLDRSIGLSLLGAGLGAAAPALTAGLGRTRKTTDRALIIEAGAGGVLLLGGLGWYLAEVTRTSATDHIAREHLAATTLGLGGGLLGASAVALIVRRLTHRPTAPISLAPTFAPHTRGLALQARF